MAHQTDVTATLARSESGDLIASDRVEGTAVYNRQGEKLGSIKNFMVGKRTGRVDYAVLSFGGLFGLGERYYPLPWDVLDYDTQQGGYVVDLDKAKIEGAPYYEPNQEPTYDRIYGERVYGYYGVPF
ncbi:PRC-barrel domain-containing protein [Sphingosinicella sp. LHD-64]|uniref:PRC-barrel domain-containing protein n=1 Tax=Sphingosinicella sp. LHD-64 TaxID=3072139 RepID=UPI00280CD4CB|nr:PRC-barrel domain-containing protein [Sphingosinicella sp. LHD-64]MDQ8757835.1 PRC-barrel domain-containing protein [Sphingosinicella sp. LHD-64]